MDIDVNGVQGTGPGAALAENEENNLVGRSS